MSPPSTPLQADQFGYLQQHIYAGSGIVLDAEKQYLLDARLAPLLRERGLASLGELCELLRSTEASPLHRQVVEAMTTNETYFFREPNQCQALREGILPEVIALRRATRKLSFWSAASSAGQEAYSLAMMLLEMGLEDWNIEILGTDLCLRVLEQAQSGQYSQLEVNRGLPVTLLLKYFRRAGLAWQLKDEVRRMAHFRPFDLRSGMRSLGPFDVVFCRNVLIYFDMVTKKRILEEIHGSLFRGGCLIVGTTEAGLPAGDRYQRQTIGNTVVYVAS